ncbi:MAG: 4'-phosphopantetheinyl transferase superfamily protein [Bdellovibrionales bacterium]
MRTKSPTLFSAPQVQLWFMDTRLLTPPNVQQILSTLSPDEVRTQARIHHPLRRSEYLGSRYLLRNLLTQTLSEHPPQRWRIGKTPPGKPALMDLAETFNVDFSLSHSGGISICALGVGCQVGVDIELRDPTVHWSELAEHALSDMEVEDLKKKVGPAQVERLFEYWTLKEAALKALATGLLSQVKNISFRIIPCSDGSRSKIIRADFHDECPSTQERWEFHTFNVKNTFQGALAVRHDFRTPLKLYSAELKEIAF